MKSIFVSIPISGKEDSYDKRLEEAVKYVKDNFSEYERIVTPKEVAYKLDRLYFPITPEYKDYLSADIGELTTCDAIFMCNEWELSNGCFAERAFAEAIGINVIYQNV